MREILANLERWRREDEAVALATLVRVEGSAPQVAGARMWVTCNGEMTGSVSGGCVESDVYERALEVLDCGQPVLAQYGVADELDLGVGLSCGGVIDVLIEPLVITEVWQRLLQALEQHQPAALAVGLMPRPLLGRKLVVVRDQDATGSIDSRLDPWVVTEALRLQANGGTCVVTGPWMDGEATIFIEGFAPPRRLLIIGATHTAVALCHLGKALDFHITIIDPRTLYATAERFPEADRIIHAWPAEALDAAPIDANTCIAVLAHDPKLDLPALARALRSEAGYVGVMGSRKTHERRRAELRKAGFSERELLRLHAPIGLDIGARTPEEISVAIIAEMLAVRYGRHAAGLTEKRDLADAAP